MGYLVTFENHAESKYKRGPRYLLCDVNINTSMRSWIIWGRRTRCVSLFTFPRICENRSRSRWMWLSFWSLECYFWVTEGFQDVSWRVRLRRFLRRWGRRRNSRLATAAMFHEETPQGADRRFKTFGSDMAYEGTSKWSNHGLPLILFIELGVLLSWC